LSLHQLNIRAKGNIFCQNRNLPKKNGRASFKKNVNYCLNTNIYSYLETSGCQSSTLY
jgi:hypothetical protein